MPRSTDRVIEKSWFTSGYIAGGFWTIFGAIIFGGPGFTYGIGILAGVIALRIVSKEETS